MVITSIRAYILTGGTVDSGTDPNELFQAFMGYANQLGREYRELRHRMQAAGIDDPQLAITELQLFAGFEATREIETHGGILSSETMPTPQTISEALYDATIIHECIRLGNFVEMLTHSATVNHGGGLQKRKERTWVDPCYYGHQMGIALAGGTPVHANVMCDTISTEHSFGDIEAFDGVPALDVMPVVQSDESTLVVMLVNRRTTHEPLSVTLTADAASDGQADVTTLTAETMHAKNTADAPERITPETSTISVRDGECELMLSPYSLTRVCLSIAD